MKHLSIAIFLFCFLFTAQSQITKNGVIQYGHEWIDFSKQYFKIEVSQNGIYKLSKAALQQAGFPVETQPMSTWSMYFLGEEIPIYTSSTGIMSESDYISFEGKRLQNDLDKHLFTDASLELNPKVSMFTDTSAYFLSFDVGENRRFINTDANIDGNTTSPEAFFMHTSLFTEAGSYIRLENSTKYGSTFDVPTGYMTHGWFLNRKLSTPHVYASGPQATYSFSAGYYESDHSVYVELNGTEISTFTLKGYKGQENTIPFDPNLLTDLTSCVINRTSSEFGFFRVGYHQITYPRRFNFDNKNSFEWTLPAKNESRYIEIENVNNAASSRIYCAALNQCIEPVVEGNVVKFKIPSSDQTLHFNLVTSNAFKQVHSIKPVNFFDFGSSNHDLVVITHPILLDTLSDGTIPMQRYTNYRKSATGGNYNPIVVNIEDLYNQFSYGINKHPFSIKNFLEHISSWEDLSHVFIIGEAVTMQYSRNLEEYRKVNLIPTYGYPGSDNYYAMHWGEKTPFVALGRLAVHKLAVFNDYIDKIEAYESYDQLPHTYENRLWKKNFLHLAGGAWNQKDYIINTLKQMGGIVEQSPIGAKVSSVYKNNTDPIDNSQTEKIKSLINNGTAVVSFFGHSAPGVFDLNIDNVEAFNNKDRYPLLISLGCYSGDIHLGSYAHAKAFVLERDKGMAGFFGTSWQGFTIHLSAFGRTFYTEYAKNNGKTVGEIFKETLIKYPLKNSKLDRNFMHQITYHGDPALRTNSFEAADYLPLYESVSTNPTFIDAFSDQFEVCFDIANIGRATDENLEFQLKHIGPKEKISTDSIFTIQAPLNQKQYCAKLPLRGQDFIGKNFIEITVDPNNTIQEAPLAAEQNNSLVNPNGTNQYEFYILSNGATPVKPKNFSIVTDENVELFSSTSNAFVQGANFKLELDTVSTFDSPLLAQTVIQNGSGLLSWKPNIDFEVNQVYYWRIAPKTSLNGLTTWSTSSFLYKPGYDEGFNQSHLHQFASNDTTSIKVESTGLEFPIHIKDYRIENFLPKDTKVPFFYVNGTYNKGCYWPYMRQYLSVVVVKKNGRFKVNPPQGSFGSTNPFSWSNPGFHFRPEIQEDRIALVEFIENETEEGDHIFFFPKFFTNLSQNNFYTDEWAADSLVNNGKNIFNVLTNLGSKSINYFRDSTMVPSVFVFQKGKGIVADVVGEDNEATVDITISIKGYWHKGEMKSVIIGPAQQWDRFEWELDQSEWTDSDSISYSIYGVLDSGSEVLLFDRETSSPLSLSSIDPIQFPNLRVVYHAKDRAHNTLPDINHWRVLYKGTPDLAILIDSSYIFKNDSLLAGDPLNVVVPVQNLSNKTIASETNVLFEILDNANKTTKISKKLPPFDAMQIHKVPLEVETKNLEGAYIVTMQVNPDKALKECYYFNNFGLNAFNVAQDNKNPYLHVTFDGQQILDGDIVSGLPEIQIELSDDNPFLLLNDTTDFQLMLTDPKGNVEEILVSTDPRITFLPATNSSNNTAYLIFKPTLDQNGYYKLWVQASDRTGNLSGSESYKISFQVINESQVSNVFNYPNPFSNATQFVFTLTGRKVPDNVKIEIMTVSGKVVRTILKEELGTLRVGLNKTEFVYDGTDMYGSPLANGVYLYRVYMDSNGEQYKKYETQTDNFFKHNLGKMVIMR